MPFSDYNRRTADEVLRDLNAAWERIKTLESQLRIERFKRWIVTGAIVVLWEGAKFGIELALHIR